MMDDIEELDLVAEVFEGLSNRSKLAILLGIADGKQLRAIAESLGITPQGLEKNIDKMLDAGLLTQNRSDGPDYQLTPIGEFFVNLLRREWDALVDAKQFVREKEDETRKSVEAARQPIAEKESEGFTFQIDDDAWEQTVQTQKWELAEDTLRDILGLPDAESDETE